MTSDRDRIVVEVPASDSRREQIERHVFEQLAALRIADRVDAIVPPRRRTGWIAIGGLAAAACLALVLFSRPSDRPVAAPVASPSYVQTPAGGSSRFTVGDAVIDAGSDTSVQVQQDQAGAVTLVLARGSIDCDVEPRRERPPFRVVAGDITVTVVGTRFTVTRVAANVRVDVARGKVRVTSPDGDRLLAPGDAWSTVAWSADGSLATAVPPPTPQQAPIPAPNQVPAEKPTVTSHVAFLAAQRLESHDRAAAVHGYRAVADGKDRWAALALYSLAELESSQHHADGALAALDEYRRRFARGANVEDAEWLRVEVLRATGRSAEVRAAAAAYVRAFPNGTYLKAAEQLASTAP